MSELTDLMKLTERRSQRGLLCSLLRQDKKYTAYFENCYILIYLMIYLINYPVSVLL